VVDPKFWTALYMQWLLYVRRLRPVMDLVSAEATKAEGGFTVTSEPNTSSCDDNVAGYGTLYSLKSYLCACV